jgi:hypothetical protein
MPVRVAITALLAVAMVATPAAADELHTVVGIDSFVASNKGLVATPVADVAVSGKVDFRDDAKHLAAGLDVVDRESLIGSPARRELHTLFVTWRASKQLAISIGRVRAPGGFWLFADGVSIQVGDPKRMAVTAIAGTRAFSNARNELDLTAHPALLPLLSVGGNLRSDRLSANLSYTFTRDLLVPLETDKVASIRVPDQFIDGGVTLSAWHDKILVDAGLSIGTRYIIDPTSPDAVRDTLPFSSQTVYGGATWKQAPWRATLATTATRSKLDRSTVMVPEGFDALSGSYVDQSARLGWHRNAWSIDGRYRFRWRPDLAVSHRITADVRWLHNHVELAGNVGYVRMPSQPDVYLFGSNALIAKASAGVRRTSLQAALGFAVQSDLTDRTVVASPEEVDTALNLFTLQNRNYLFARGYYSRGSWLVGAEVEATPNVDHVRAFVQLLWGHG